MIRWRSVAAFMYMIQLSGSEASCSWSSLKKDTRLSVTRCGVESVPHLSTSNIQHVHTLDLSNNRLKILPKNSFSEWTKLENLILSNNMLEDLVSHQFGRLMSLRRIDLSSNKIIHLHNKTFINQAESLQEIDLSNNQLTTLSDIPFLYLIDLKLLNLPDNPWNCDCHLQKLRRFVVQRKLANDALRCQQPERLKIRKWTEVPQADFACPPKVSVQKSPLTVRQGDLATVTCQVQGSPTPAAHWLKDGKVLVTEIPSSTRESSISISLKMNSTSKSMGGLYTCVAINHAGISRKELNVVVRNSNLLLDMKWELLFIIIVAAIIVIFSTLITLCKTINR